MQVRDHIGLYCDPYIIKSRKSLGEGLSCYHLIRIRLLTMYELDI